MNTIKQIIKRIFFRSKRKPILKFYLLVDGIYYQGPELGNKSVRLAEKISKQYVDSLRSNPKYDVRIVESSNYNHLKKHL